MSYQVTARDVVARPTAVVPVSTTWLEYPALWPELLDEVWACLHAGGIKRGCRNIMLYWDDVPHVEVGVESLVPCPLTGRVVASALLGLQSHDQPRAACSVVAPSRWWQWRRSGSRLLRTNGRALEVPAHLEALASMCVPDRNPGAGETG